jgi:predicted porin
MKKIIFSVVCCCTVAIVAAEEAKWKVIDDILLGEWLVKKAECDSFLRFWGDGNLTAAFINQSIPGDLDSGSISYAGNVYMKFLNKGDNLAFGGQVRVRPKSGMVKCGDTIVDEAFLILESDHIGEFRAGFTNTAADNFIIGGDQLLPAYGGPGGGNLGIFYNQSAGTILGSGCSIDDNKAAKVVWYSPVMRGFSLGSSFTFHSRRMKPFKLRRENYNGDRDGCWDFANTSAYSKNVVTIAGKYEHGSSKGFNASAVVAGWIGQGRSGFRNIEVRNVRAFHVGASLGYKDFKLSAGYIDNGKSLLPKSYATADLLHFDPNVNYDITDPRLGIRSGANAGKLYTIGASYKFDKLTLGVNYFRSVVKFSSSKQEKAVSDIVTVAAEYSLNKTFSVYVEYNNIVTGTCDRARAYKQACGLSSVGANRANIIMLGTKYNF